MVWYARLRSRGTRTLVLRRHWHDGDLLALLEVVTLLLSLRVALRLRPFRDVRRWVVARARRVSRVTTEGQPDDDRTLRRAMLRGVRLLPGSTCLPQALTGLLFAARRGVRARVFIGVQVGISEPFGAHAWLATDRGVVLGEDESARFAPLVLIDPFAAADPQGAWR